MRTSMRGTTPWYMIAFPNGIPYAAASADPFPDMPLRSPKRIALRRMMMRDRSA